LKSQSWDVRFVLSSLQCAHLRGVGLDHGEESGGKSSVLQVWGDVQRLQMCVINHPAQVQKGSMKTALKPLFDPCQLLRREVGGFQINLGHSVLEKEQNMMKN